ncbi:hypothetical protein JVU11DRAFT_7704 [Chiua virens]|nr:hypothetical protein JVU11DRAFT_7704 [Chiua virens]
MLVRQLSVLSFVALAFGGPLFGRNPRCNDATMQCCNDVKPANSSEVTSASMGPSAPLGLADLLMQLPANTPVGLNCDPITAGAGSSAGCNTNTVCCTNTSFNGGLINVGCVSLADI